MITANVTLDAIGMACPMPIVKTKKAIGNIGAGEVIEVLATDKGSKADMKAWADRTGHQYLGTVEENGVLKHYIRKAGGEETEEKKHSQVIDNEELMQRMNQDQNAVVLDVRESAEYAFGHIPHAISIPLGELNDRLNELNREAELLVVCRTGNRSDLAAQQLSAAGFHNVTNVVPGMSKWEGPTEKSVGGK